MEGKKKRIRKIISTIVAVALIVTMMPAADYAYGETIVPAESSDATNVETELTMPEVSEEDFFAIEAEWKVDQKRRKLHRATLSGSGTVSDPYLIYTPADLQSMVDNDHSCYKLMRDIDLKGRNWRPPGYYYWYPFMGYLDGNGHKVTNLYVGGTQQDAWNINAGGFFGFLEGRVENLGVETVKAQGKGVNFFGTAGGIAGVANAPAEIINCYFNGYVAGSSYVGGLVGIAYPGTVIENCCALGTVDMSQGYEYLNDNELQWIKDVFNATMDIGTYALGATASAAGGYTEGGSINAWIEGLWDAAINSPELLIKITGTDYLTGVRKCSIGGLAGLNYGWIYNSYAANKLYNVKTAMATSTKMGGIVARNVEDCSEAQINNCFYNKDISDPDGGYDGQFKARGKTTSQLKSKETSGLVTKHWNYSAKILSKKSTGGYPLPKINKVKRSKRVDKKTGIVYEPEIYYQSRVLMRTRADFAIGTPHTSPKGIESTKCTICENLIKDREKATDKNDSKYNSIAVTGIYQRGTKSMPYHVHDIDSMLGLQDKKEFNYLLCDDIDFKVSDHEGNTVQKYWWPAGKTHFSPIKGYFKGNTSVTADYKINSKVRPRKVSLHDDVFTIKNLTVQTNRLAGLFATLRGTFSDINVELASGQVWKDWRDGIKGIHNKTVGISSIGDIASAGAIAGDVVTGGVIRNCMVGGPQFTSRDPDVCKLGYVSSPLRGGGVVGFLDRGAKIQNVETYIWVDVNNYELHYSEDSWAFNLKVIGAAAETIKTVVETIKEYIGEIEKLNNFVNEFKNAVSRKSLSGDTLYVLDKFGVKEDDTKASKDAFGEKSGWRKGNIIVQKIMEVLSPLTNWWLEQYSMVCRGYIVGESYGNVYNCTAYNPKFNDYKDITSPWWNAFMAYNLVGFQGFEEKSVAVSKALEDMVEDTNQPKRAEDVWDTSATTEQELLAASYNRENGNRTCSVASMERGLSGAGTEAEPFTIASEADLREIARRLDEGYDFEGDCILQLDHIEMTEPFECMGLSSRTPFKGNYYGNNCVIEGIKVENNSSAALFYKLDKALVSDLTIKEGVFAGAQAAAIAIEAVNGSLIYNCGSVSDVRAAKNNAHEDRSKAAGLVLKLQDSNIGNSYVKGKVSSGYIAAGIAHTIEGNSELANCYVGSELSCKVDSFIAGIGNLATSGNNCTMYNCYWPEEYQATDGIYQWKAAADNHAYSRDYMKSQQFVNKLNTVPNSNSAINFSDRRLWEVVAGDYPQFFPYYSIEVIQPAGGKIKAEYSFSDKWYELNTRILGKGTDIRLTVEDMPVGKTIDYWMRNGQRINDTNSMVFNRYENPIHENSIFEVVFKEQENISYEGQTRDVNVDVPEHGKLTLVINAIYGSEGTGDIPSRTVVIEQSQIEVQGHAVIPANEKTGETTGQEIYSESEDPEDPENMLRIRRNTEGSYILTVPYGAQVEVSYKDPDARLWLNQCSVNSDDGQVTPMDEIEPYKFVGLITHDSDLDAEILTVSEIVKKTTGR